MISLIRAMAGLFRGAGMMSDEEYYYNGAVDRIDLERRMRAVQKGEAPFQRDFRW